MSQSERSPLACLVLFMICLAIAGSVIAGAHYVAIDLPAQKNLHAPQNNGKPIPENCKICRDNCAFNPRWSDCMSSCELLSCQS